MPKLTLISNKMFPVEIETGDDTFETLNFRMVEMSEFMRLKGLAVKVIGAVADIVDRSSAMPSQKSITKNDPLSGRMIEQVIETGALSDSDAVSAASRRQKAMARLADLFLAEENLKVTYRLVANSLRDEGYTADEIAKADIGMFAQLLMGFLEANMGVLLPLVNRLSQMGLLNEQEPGESQAENGEPSQS